jgi:hypothetical protein
MMNEELKLRAVIGTLERQLETARRALVRLPAPVKDTRSVRLLEMFRSCEDPALTIRFAKQSS